MTPEKEKPQYSRSVLGRDIPWLAKMQEKFWADSALIDPSEDRLAFAPFANKLASAISEAKSDGCIIFSLLGAWGSGKTTCLNFVRHIINQSPESPTIIEFNPWWFSGHADILHQFLRQYLATLGKDKKLRKLANSVGKLLGATSAIPYAKTAAKLIDLLCKEESLVKLREEIKKTLIASDTRFLIIVDDIDRLTSEEIKELFCAIKAIADFPRTSYLLAFDKDVVVQALDQQSNHRGLEYLEKIVQIPFDLPVPERYRLNKLFTEMLDEIYGNVDSALFDRTYWTSVFYKGIDKNIGTVRNIKRLINALKVTYPGVNGEVNAVDFIAIETIRVFHSKLYDIIRHNPDMFTGHAELPFYDDLTKEKIEAFHAGWLQKYQHKEIDEESMKEFLMLVFPRLEAVFKNTEYGAEFLTTWRKQLRVCSPDIFPIYFRLSLPEGQVENSELKSLLLLGGDAGAFANGLERYSHVLRPDGGTKVREILDRLLDYADDEIPLEHIPTILQALFQLGDKLLIKEDRGRGLFGLGNDVSIIRILFRFIPRIKNQDDRLALLKTTLSYCDSLIMIVNVVEDLGQQQGKYGSRKRPESEWFVNSEQLTKLESIAVKEIKESALSGKLMKEERAIQMLYRWRDWENPEAVKKYTNDIVAADEGLAYFISRFFTGGDSREKDVIGIDPNWEIELKNIEPLVSSLSEIAGRCEKIVTAMPEWLKEKEKKAVEIFLRSYKLIIKDKKT